MTPGSPEPTRRAETKLMEAVEDALAAGLDMDDIRVWSERAFQSIQGDRAFAIDEQGRDPYPHIKAKP